MAIQAMYTMAGSSRSRPRRRTEPNGRCTVDGTSGGARMKNVPPRRTKPSQKLMVQKAMTLAISTAESRQALYRR